MRGVCQSCNIHPVMSKGNGKWGKYCSSCHKKPWVLHKGDKCECCGFVPTHRVQLDVDHVDGDKGNNNPENLQTLCANCHRLKTFLNGDCLCDTSNDVESETPQLRLV